jgi:hypothetical protein
MQYDLGCLDAPPEEVCGVWRGESGILLNLARGQLCLPGNRYVNLSAPSRASGFSLEDQWTADLLPDDYPGCPEALPDARRKPPCDLLISGNHYCL